MVHIHNSCTSGFQTPKLHRGEVYTASRGENYTSFIYLVLAFETVQLPHYGSVLKDVQLEALCLLFVVKLYKPERHLI